MGLYRGCSIAAKAVGVVVCILLLSGKSGFYFLFKNKAHFGQKLSTFRVSCFLKSTFSVAPGKPPFFIENVKFSLEFSFF